MFFYCEIFVVWKTFFIFAKIFNIVLEIILDLAVVLGKMCKYDMGRNPPLAQVQRNIACADKSNITSNH